MHENRFSYLSCAFSYEIYYYPHPIEIMAKLYLFIIISNVIILFILHVINIQLWNTK